MPLDAEIRYAVRSLLRRPGYAVVAAVTIGLAIAGNTAMFSLVNGVLLRPLPFGEPQRLVTLDVISPEGYYISTSIPNYRDWGERSRAFDRYGATAGWNLNLTGRGQAETLNGQAMLGDFFRTLGLRPLLGRVIEPDETERGAESVVVLGHRFWQRRLGGSADVLGQTLVLDDRPYVIVGVLPPGDGYPAPATDLYIPMGSLPGLPWDQRDSSFGTRVLARLAPDVTLEAARADLARVDRELAEAVGPVATPQLRALGDHLLGNLRAQLWVLMGAVAFVLLIAVSNVGNLQLARAEERRREIAVRAALGAGRGRIVRTLLIESLVLALAGGLFGLVLAHGALRLAAPFLPAMLPGLVLGRIGVDATVMLFTFGVAALAGVLFGALPALRASSAAPAEELKEGGRGASRGRRGPRAALVVAEVALSLVLLIGAGLMIRSLAELRNVDKGFDARGVLTARAPVADQRYPDKEAWRAFYAELLDRARSLPGVRSAALTLAVPLAGRSWEMGIVAEGAPREASESFLLGIVSPEYFETMGVPIVRGRSFDEADRDGGSLVAVIDETMAERFWPGADPIGKRVSFEAEMGEGGEHTPVYRTVVGVTRNVRHYELESPSRIQLYIPFAQTRERWGYSLYIALRTAAPPASLIGPLRRELQAIDPDVPLTSARPMQAYVDDAMLGSRAMGGLLAGFGGLALLLAAVGIFGVISYSVAQRTKEIGIRMALGADAPGVMRWISRQALVLAAAGIALGLGAALALTRLLRGFLYGVEPFDPGVYGILAVLLLGAAMAAAYLPARRATRVDPVQVLNREL